MRAIYSEQFRQQLKDQGRPLFVYVRANGEEVIATSIAGLPGTAAAEADERLGDVVDLGEVDHSVRNEPA